MFFPIFFLFATTAAYSLVFLPLFNFVASGPRGNVVLRMIALVKNCVLLSAICNDSPLKTPSTHLLKFDCIEVDSARTQEHFSQNGRTKMLSQIS